VTEDNSKDLKVAVGMERSLQGSRRRNAVPPPTIEEVTEVDVLAISPQGVTPGNLMQILKR